MSNEIKSGADTLHQFFSDLAGDEAVDSDTRAIVIKLFTEGKLTTTNVANALRELRKEKLSDED